MSVQEALEFRIAKSAVDDYKVDPVMQDGRDALACEDCEKLLTKGIEAFRWLDRCDETIREAVYKGFVEYDDEAKEAIQSLYRDWLAPCDAAEQWACKLEASGCRPANVDEFRSCRAIAEDRVQRTEWLRLGRKSRSRAFADETW